MLTTTPAGTSSDKDSPKPFLVPHASVPVYWDSMKPFVQKSVEKSFGLITTEQLQDMLFANVAHAFLMMRRDEIVSVFVVSKVHYAEHRAMRILSCAGQEIKAAYDCIHVFESWALTQGCVELEGWCRPAMVRFARKYGWQPQLTRITRDLRRKLQ